MGTIGSKAIDLQTLGCSSVLPYIQGAMCLPPAMSHEIVPYGKGKGKSIDDAQLRKFTKRTVDYGSDVVRWMEDCVGRRTRPRHLQRHYNYTKELVPPFAMPRNPYDGICPRFVYAAVNKNRSPVYVATWFPNGRRILTGTLAGEMTIWNGLAFHSENVMQAHNAGIKAMCWTPDEAVMVSGDQLGMIKLWDPFIYNFQTFQGHKDSVCDIAVAPTGEKFCSCADDSHAKVWDLKTGEEERAFTGHGWDVKCCAWHPTKGLVATGSKDSQIKLWDPRASEAITTIFCHKNTVTRVAWSPHGQWLASASRDQLVMLMDVRTMSVRKVFKAHQKEVTSLCWHPESDSLLACDPQSSFGSRPILPAICRRKTC
ncbi:WDR33 [Symbiodinium necroappetens]|uniref:WDR33 protein n=1 Tax=Symbiodinium necroappetens TaxID=1628268 RepID=A0A812NVR5_9DINO|nr:WDR33 [Symbiodinium necroappetens]